MFTQQQHTHTHTHTRPLVTAHSLQRHTRVGQSESRLGDTLPHTSSFTVHGSSTGSLTSFSFSACITYSHLATLRTCTMSTLTIAMELSPFVITDHSELAAPSHSFDPLSASPSTASSSELLSDRSATSSSSSSPLSVPSQYCPQPSPLTAVLAASIAEPSSFSLDAAPAPSQSAALTPPVPSTAVPSFTWRELLLGLYSPFAPVPHRLRWARRLFWMLAHPLTLLYMSLVMAACQLLLLYASIYTLYLLYHSPPSERLSRLPTAVFTVFSLFLVLRSCAYLYMVAARVVRIQLWVNVPAANASRLARGYYPSLLLLRVLSLLFLLVATATLIFATPLTLSSASTLLIFMLLSYDAVTLSLPLLIVPSLAFLLPLHTLHMSFPFIPIAPPQPSGPQPGMSAAQLAQLDESVWQRPSADDETVCAVCLCELVEGERVRRLPKCSHAFHVACIDSWLQRRAKCPLCVQTVEVSGCAVDATV